MTGGSLTLDEQLAGLRALLTRNPTLVEVLTMRSGSPVFRNTDQPSGRGSASEVRNSSRDGGRGPGRVSGQCARYRGS